MHNLDIGHGDLHEWNILYKDNDNNIDIKIIDYDNSYYISTGKNNPILREYIEESFDWEDTYEEFVNYDYINWTVSLNSRREPKSIVFTNIIDINVSSKYMGINSYELAYAIRKTLMKIYSINFDIYGVYLNKSNILHYFVRMPGGLFYTDIKGMNTKQEQKDYWYNFLFNNNYNIQNLEFVKIDIIDMEYTEEINNLSNLIKSEINDNIY